MDENRDHFLCGICKAGFRSSSFLQFLEHMVRHFSVNRNNKCIICHKGFARTPSLKDHLLHFHAIPLKVRPDCNLEAECSSNNTSVHGCARCNFQNKKEISADKGVTSCASTHNQSQSPYLFCVNGTTNLPVNSEIITLDGMEPPDASVDVLTIRDVDQNITSNMELFSQQSRQFSGNSVEDGISFGTSPPKDINPNLFLVDPRTRDMNLDQLTKSLSSDKVLGFGDDTEVNLPPNEHDFKINMTPYVDRRSTKIDNDSYGINTNTQNSKEIFSSDAQVNMKSYEVCAFDPRNTYSCPPMKTIPQPHNSHIEQAVVPPHSLVVDVNNVSNADFHVINKSDTYTDSINQENAFNTTSTIKTNMSSKSKSETNGNTRLAKVNEESIDFHFFLGTTVINGSSMTYNRLEFRCLHCTFVCAWRPSLLKHMRNSHEEALAFHRILDIKSIKSNSMVDEKLKKYKVIKLSEYLLSNNKARKRRGVRGIERQDILGKYSCPICNKVFRRMRYLRRHQLCHRTERCHLCDTCGKSFKTISTFVTHHHSHKSRCYHCPQCDFVSNLTSAIHRHRQIHTNGSVICDICGSAYMDKSTLKKHGRVHDMSRPFPCTFPGCTWRFKSESMKKAHFRSHTTEGKFRCPQCGYRFRHKHHLQRHLSRVHSQVNLPSKLHEVLRPTLDLQPNIAGPSIFYQQDHLCEGDMIKKATSNLTLCSPRPGMSSQELLLSSIGEESIQPTTQIQSHSSMDIKLPQSTVDIFVEDKPPIMDTPAGNKPLDTSMVIDLENGFEDMPSDNLNNLEYVTENGEIIQLVKPQQVYVRQDQCGNLVEYRITDIRQGEDNQSQPVYFIGADGTVLGSGSQDQGLLLP